jgi:hypothetical protein
VFGGKGRGKWHVVTERAFIGAVPPKFAFMVGD